MTSPLLNTAVSLALSIILGGGACSQSNALPSALQQRAMIHQSNHMLFVRQHFRDTLYLSQLAGQDHSGEDFQQMAVLPTLMRFVDCQFDAPVYAAPGQMLALGGHLDFQGSHLRAGLNLQGIMLSQGLNLDRVISSGEVKLNGMQTPAEIRMEKATFHEAVQLGNSSVGRIYARLASFEKDIFLQRMHVQQSLNFIEAQFQGYVDASYVRVLGDAFFDLSKCTDRLTMDYADFYARCSLSQVKWPNWSLRHVRMRGPIDGWQDLTQQAGSSEGFKSDLQPELPSP